MARLFFDRLPSLADTWERRRKEDEERRRRQEERQRRLDAEQAALLRRARIPYAAQDPVVDRAMRGEFGMGLDPALDRKQWTHQYPPDPVAEQAARGELGLAYPEGPAPPEQPDYWSDFIQSKGMEPEQVSEMNITLSDAMAEKTERRIKLLRGDRPWLAEKAKTYVDEVMQMQLLPADVSLNPLRGLHAAIQQSDDPVEEAIGRYQEWLNPKSLNRSELEELQKWGESPDGKFEIQFTPTMGEDLLNLSRRDQFATRTPLEERRKRIGTDPFFLELQDRAGGTVAGGQLSLTPEDGPIQTRARTYTDALNEFVVGQLPTEEPPELRQIGERPVYEYQGHMRHGGLSPVLEDGKQVMEPVYAPPPAPPKLTSEEMLRLPFGDPRTMTGKDYGAFDVFGLPVADSMRKFVSGTVGTAGSFALLPDLGSKLLGFEGGPEWLNELARDAEFQVAMINEGLTDLQKNADFNLAKTRGLQEAIQGLSPRAAWGMVMESLPFMLASGATGLGARSFMGVVGKSFAKNQLKQRTIARLPAVLKKVGKPVVDAFYWGVGEGIVSMAAAYQQMEDRDTRDAWLATFAGGGVALIGGFSNRLAHKWGIADPDQLLTNPTAPTGAILDDLAESGVSFLSTLGRRVGAPSLLEGVEELGQSGFEQAMNNLSTGKPWYEELGRAGALGAITGILASGSRLGPGGFMEAMAREVEASERSPEWMKKYMSAANQSMSDLMYVAKDAFGVAADERLKELNEGPYGGKGDDAFLTGDAARLVHDEITLERRGAGTLMHMSDDQFNRYLNNIQEGRDPADGILAVADLVPVVPTKSRNAERVKRMAEVWVDVYAAQSDGTHPIKAPSRIRLPRILSGRREGQVKFEGMSGGEQKLAVSRRDWEKQQLIWQRANEELNKDPNWLLGDITGPQQAGVKVALPDGEVTPDRVEGHDLKLVDDEIKLEALWGEKNTTPRPEGNRTKAFTVKNEDGTRTTYAPSKRLFEDIKKRGGIVGDHIDVIAHESNVIAAEEVIRDNPEVANEIVTAALAGDTSVVTPETVRYARVVRESIQEDESLSGEAQREIISHEISRRAMGEKPYSTEQLIEEAARVGASTTGVDAATLETQIEEDERIQLKVDRGEKLTTAEQKTLGEQRGRRRRGAAAVRQVVNVDAQGRALDSRRVTEPDEFMTGTKEEMLQDRVQNPVIPVEEDVTPEGLGYAQVGDLVNYRQGTYRVSDKITLDKPSAVRNQTIPLKDSKDVFVTLVPEIVYDAEGQVVRDTGGGDLHLTTRKQKDDIAFAPGATVVVSNMDPSNPVFSLRQGDKLLWGGPKGKVIKRSETAPDQAGRKTVTLIIQPFAAKEGETVTSTIPDLPTGQQPDTLVVNPFETGDKDVKISRRELEAIVAEKKREANSLYDQAVPETFDADGNLPSEQRELQAEWYRLSKGLEAAGKVLRGEPVAKEKAPVDSIEVVVKDNARGPEWTSRLRTHRLVAALEVPELVTLISKILTTLHDKMAGRKIPMFPRLAALGTAKGRIAVGGDVDEVMRVPVRFYRMFLSHYESQTDLMDVTPIKEDADDNGLVSIQRQSSSPMKVGMEYLIGNALSISKTKTWMDGSETTTAEQSAASKFLDIYRTETQRLQSITMLIDPEAVRRKVETIDDATGKVTKTEYESADNLQVGAILAHELGHVVNYADERVVKSDPLLNKLRAVYDEVMVLADGNDRKWKKGDLKAEEQKLRDQAEVLSFIWRPFDEETVRKFAEKKREKAGELKDRLTIEESLERVGPSKRVGPPLTEVEKKAIDDERRELENEANELIGHIKYRKSTIELFADFFSALIVNPAIAQAFAPGMVKMFLDHMDRRDDVGRALTLAWDEIFNDSQIAVDERRPLVDRRIKRIYEGLLLSEKTLKDHFDEQILAKKMTPEKAAWGIYRDFVEKHAPVLRKWTEWLKDQGLKAQDVHPNLRVDLLLARSNYLSGAVRGYIEEHFGRFHREAAEVGLTWSQIGSIVQMKRIASGDRSGYMNPGGVNKEGDAQEILDQMLEGLSEEQQQFIGNLPGGATVAGGLLDRFSDAVWEVTEWAKSEGLFSQQAYDELAKRRDEGRFYATFQSVFHVTEELSPEFHPTEGMFEPTRNPVTATMLKMAAVVRAIEWNNIKRGVIQQMEIMYSKETALPEDEDTLTGKDERVRYNGTKKKIIDGREVTLHLVHFRESGKSRAVYVAREIAESLSHQSTELNNNALKWVKSANEKLFRPLFTVANPGFQIVNLWRDFWRFYRNLSHVGRQVGFFQSFKRYYQAHGMARARVFGERREQGVLIFGSRMLKGGKLSNDEQARAQEAMDNVILMGRKMAWGITLNDFFEGKHEDDPNAFSDSSMLGLESDSQGRRLFGSRHMGRVYDFIKHTGDYIETLPKAAAAIHIAETKYGGDMTQLDGDDIRFIRERVGSPDFLAGGTQKGWSNELFLFSNAMIQGWRSDIATAKDPETRSGFMWRMFGTSIMPKMLMYAAREGLAAPVLATLQKVVMDISPDEWDEEAEELFTKLNNRSEKLTELYQSMSTYDMMNYMIFPMWEDSTSGHVAYLRIPMGDTQRVIGGLFYSMLLGLPFGGQPSTAENLVGSLSAAELDGWFEPSAAGTLAAFAAGGATLFAQKKFGGSGGMAKVLGRSAVSGVLAAALTHRAGKDDAVREVLSGMTTYTGEQLPGLSPMVTLPGGIFGYLASSMSKGFPNLGPYEHWRGTRPVFTEEEYSAGVLGLPSTEVGANFGDNMLDRLASGTGPKMLGWTWNELGGGILHRFNFYQEAAEKGAMQSISEAPVLSNVLGRFFRWTDYGKQESRFGAAQKAKAENAQINIQIQTAVTRVALPMYTDIPYPDRTSFDLDGSPSRAMRVQTIFYAPKLVTAAALNFNLKGLDQEPGPNGERFTNPATGEKFRPQSIASRSLSEREAITRFPTDPSGQIIGEPAYFRSPMPIGKPEVREGVALDATFSIPSQASDDETRRFTAADIKENRRRVDETGGLTPPLDVPSTFSASDAADIMFAQSGPADPNLVAIDLTKGTPMQQWMHALNTGYLMPEEYTDARGATQRAEPDVNGNYVLPEGATWLPGEKVSDPIMKEIVEQAVRLEDQELTRGDKFEYAADRVATSYARADNKDAVEAIINPPEGVTRIAVMQETWRQHEDTEEGNLRVFTDVKDVTRYMPGANPFQRYLNWMREDDDASMLGTLWDRRANSDPETPGLLRALERLNEGDVTWSRIIRGVPNPDGTNPLGIPLGTPTEEWIGYLERRLNIKINRGR